MSQGSGPVMKITKESRIEKTYSSENLPSPPFGKGREGIYLQCLYNYGLTNKKWLNGSLIIHFTTAEASGSKGFILTASEKR